MLDEYWSLELVIGVGNVTFNYMSGGKWLRRSTSAGDNDNRSDIPRSSLFLLFAWFVFLWRFSQDLLGNKDLLPIICSENNMLQVGVHEVSIICLYSLFINAIFSWQALSSCAIMPDSKTIIVGSWDNKMWVISYICCVLRTFMGISWHLCMHSPVLYSKLCFLYIQAIVTCWKEKKEIFVYVSCLSLPFRRM